MAVVGTSTPGRRSVARRPGGRTARVRRAIFDATLTLLADGGYQSLTVDAVAAAAGVNKTTIYRNWPTRTALIHAAAKERSEAMIVTRVTGDPERDLVAFLRSVAENVSSSPGRALVIATLNGSGDSEVRAARDAFWQGRFHAAGPLIRAATNDPSLSDSEVELFIERLIAPIYFRVFITGTAVGEGFIRDTAREALRIGAPSGTGSRF